MKKALFFLIIFSLAFAPLLPVMAEEPADALPAEPIVLESPLDNTATLSDPATVLPLAGDVLAPAPETQIAENIADNQVVNLNDGPQRDPAENEQGAYQQEKSADNSFKKQAGLTGELRVDQFSGAASYSIGLEIPPGRSGLNPSLVLAYNSHDRSNDSWVGQGWSLPLGSIQRTTKRGTNNLYTSNEFTLFLGGSSKEIIEVDAENHLYAPKEESDYLKIQYLPDSSSWLITDTKGIKYYFGQTAESRQDDPADQNKIFKWQLDKVLDTNDNFYRIEYVKRNGQVYPSRIVYTGYADQDGPMEMLFNLEERGDDNSTSYQTQFAVTTDRRLNNIEIKVSGQTVSRYQVAYSAGQNGRTSLLSSITKKGYVGDREFSLPTTTFSYSSKQTGWTDDTDNWQEITDFNYTNPKLMDFNGDSWVDMGRSFHNGHGFGGGQDWNFGDDSMTYIADFNGDKLPDFAAPYPENNHNGRPVAYLNNGINGYNYSAQWSAILRYLINRDVPEQIIGFTDVNADGLDDIIHAYNQGNSRVRNIRLNTGNGFTGAYGDFPIAIAYCENNVWPLRCSSLGVQIADINNDGLADVFRSGQVYLNTGAGFEQEPNQQWSIVDFNLPEGMQDPWQRGAARLTDLNGDGLLDITIAAVETLLRDHNWVQVEYFASWLNTGSGWQRDDHWNLPMVLTSLDLEASDWGVRLLDINNDNSIDVVKANLRIGFNGERSMERQVYLGSSTQGNQLMTVANGYGGQTELGYQPSGQYFTEDEEFANPHLPLNLQTVKIITTTDGQGNEIVTNYDYQDGAYYSDPSDYTLNQFTGFGIVTSQTGDQIAKTYYHQGSGIDGYENGEYEDTIYKKGRPYREEVYQETEGELILQSAKVSTWKQENLNNNRKYVYLDGTVAYDYTAEGEQQQMMPRLRQDFGEQAVNQQSIQQSEVAQALPTEQLSQLQQAQTFSPIAEPQLVSQSEDGWLKTYYLGRQESGQHIFRHEVFSGGNEIDEPARDENERGDARFNNFEYSSTDGYIYYSNNRFPNRQEDWNEIINAQVGTNVDRNSNQAGLYNNPLGVRTPYGLSRVFIPFNTSELPEDITITRASLSLTVSNGLNIGSATIVNSNQHTNQLQVEDYGTVGNTDGGRIYVDDQGRRTTQLNEIGRSWINTDGWTKLALRASWDFENQAPPQQGGNHTSDIVMSDRWEARDNWPLLSVEFYYNNINPGVPTDLQVENQVNPDDVADQTPEFTAVYNDENQDDQAIAYRVQVIRATNLYGANNDYNGFAAPLWDSGRVEFNEPVANGQRSPQIQYGNELPLDGRQYFWRIKFWDSGDEVHSEGLWSDGQDYFYMDGSAAPVASVNLLTESRVEPRDLLNQNPSFSAIYRDPNPIDMAKWYQVQIIREGGNFENQNDLVWDSEKQQLNQLVDNGVRSEEIQYNGEPLAYDGILYYWRIKFWDDEEENGTQGAWSESATFSMFNSEDVLDNVQAKAAKFHYNFSNGNLIEEENLGAVSAAQNGVFLNIAEEVIGDEKNSTYSYAEPINESIRILAAPSEKVIANPNNENESATVTISYDGRDDGLVEKANPTKEDLNMPQTVYQKTFNDYGLVTSSIDPLNHQTTVTYDVANYYPATTRNHLNQTTQTAYDLATGQVKRVVDPNGVVEERDYDAFGRLAEVRKTNPLSTSLLALQRYEYHDVDNPSWVRQINYPGQSFELSVYSYFDGLGRTIQTREQTDINSDYRVVSYAYDAKGNLYNQTLPYIVQNSAYSQPDWNLPRTQYLYDAQNRVVQESVITPENTYTTAYEYDGWNVTITDANNNLKKLYKDAYGQLIQVDEYLNGEIYSTRYEYSLLGKIIKITDSQGNERNFTYDSLGRLLSQEEMHRANAQQFGVWSYEYDSASNLIRKTDAKGQVTNYTYDALNRIVTEDYQGQEGTEVTYAYDTGTYGKGRLYRVVSEGAIVTYTYDKWGRVTKEAKTVNGWLYNTQWAYNLQSVPTSIAYPDNSKVYYSYNKEALPIRIRTAGPGQNIVDSMPLINNVIYSPLKQIQRIEYNSGIVSENTFDPVQGYRLTHKRTENPFGLVIQDLTYEYDNVGNIIRLLDESETLLAKTTAYQYDDLYRLIQATVTGSANNQDYEQTYVYDPLGNILNKSDIGDYLYQYVHPHQASSINGQEYQYDANGNLTSDGAKIYHYNYNDRLASVDISANNVLSNLYDHSGARTLKQLTSTKLNQDPEGGEIIAIAKTIYPNSLYEEETQGLEGDEQNWQTKKIRHISLGNQTIAHVNVDYQGNVEQALVFGDHLGSASLLTDSFGRPKVLYDYYPFGSTRMEQNIGGMGIAMTDYRYTGKELDEEINLHYYGQRYYNQNVGQFTQPDPLFLKIALSDEVKKITGQTQEQILQNPQLLNAYAYTANNPVKYTDPDGNFLFLIPAIPYIFTGAVALLGAYSAWQTGQTAGYAIEGDYIKSELAAAKNQLALTAIAALGEGALAIMPLTVTNSNKLKQSVQKSNLQQPNLQGEQSKIPDNALCVRGGSCTAQRFEIGNEGPLRNGKLTNVSTQSDGNLSLQDLTKNLPQSKIGVTTVGQVRSLGGNVVPAGHDGNPYHANLQGITPQQAQSLFTPIQTNPWFKK